MKSIELPRQGFRDFDLPVEHLIDERHYIPPKTHDPSEAIRRRELNRGTLIAEQQLRGLKVAKTILDNLDEEEGLLFASDLLACSGLNSAWYSYAQRSQDVMRRRLKLPVMITKRNQNPDMFMEDTLQIMDSAVLEAGRLVGAMEYDPRRIDERQRKVGVRSGNAAIRLACYGSVLAGEFAMYPNEVETQGRVRELGLKALAKARSLHREMGSHPSLAQLSDPYSHLSVYWHRRAPGSAQTAVVEALAA